MNNGQKSLSINETFIVESIESAEILSACTAIYSNSIISCSGNTAILLQNGVISFNGNILAPVISGGTYYGDGSNLTGISTQDTYVTGGTYSNGIATFTNNTGGTFSVSGFYTGYTAPTDVFVTGGTFDSVTGIATFTNNTGGTFSVTGFENFYTTGATLIDNVVYFDRNDTLSAYTLNLSGFSTQDLYITGVSFNSNVLSLYRNDGVELTTNIDSFGSITATTYYGDGSNLTGISTQDTFITGGTYSDGTAVFTNNTGGTFNVTGFYTGFTGGVVSGLTATTISATTYQNLPLDIRVTGGTYNQSNGVATFKNNSGGTFNVNGFYTGFSGGSVSGLTAITISATTYKNLPTDIRVTGGTYYDGVTTFTNNTGGTFSIEGPSNYNAGTIFGSQNWINNHNGSITLPDIKVALFDNANYIEPLRIYSISSGTTGVGGIPPLTNNDTNYILIEYNGGSPRYNVLNNDGTINNSDVVLYMIVYRANNFVHTLEFGNFGAGLPNKLNARLIATDRFARESGCALGLSGSTGVVTLSSGVVWNGSYRQIVAAVNSNDDIFFKNFHSGGTWVYSTTGNTINNTFYDDGTNLVSATAGKYLVNWYFRGQEINDHLYELISYGEYDTVQLAEASPEPNLPELISSHAFLTGRIIIQVSATTGITQSAFSTVFQPSGAPTLHNDLAGIQGGLAGEYYHLDSNSYNNLALTNVDNNFSVQQTFNSGIITDSISATTYQNLPTDVFVTGATYTAGTAVFTNNTGGTFNVSGFNDIFVRNETNASVTDTITINQSIFNPSNLTVLNTSIFIIDTNADYYVLGDLINNGSIIINGTLKVGGQIYNSGTITGSGTLE